MKTIKEIASEQGAAKQRVYRIIKKYRINESLQRNGAMWYDETAERLIIQHLSETVASGEAHQSASNETVIDTLIKQLEIKDAQIAALQTALNNEQMLHAATKNLLPSTIETTAADPAPETQGFFVRLKNLIRKG